MGFYDLTKEERIRWVEKINRAVLADLQVGSYKNITRYFSDEDTYIRKAAYQAVGKVWNGTTALHAATLRLLEDLYTSANEKVRQTAINAAGEIGTCDFGVVQHLFDRALFDHHPTVRNAVIGSVKKMSAKNPTPVLAWARKYLHHPDKEVRREICHGIELRGRTHPQDILPLLQELQFDKTARVRNTLVHVLGQIAYKKGCLATVVAHLRAWENQELVAKALAEIIDVHHRYKAFAIMTQKQAVAYIGEYFDAGGKGKDLIGK